MSILDYECRTALGDRLLTTEVRTEAYELFRSSEETYKCGHPRSDENTHLRKDGSTRCLACERERDRARWPGRRGRR